MPFVRLLAVLLPLCGQISLAANSTGNAWSVLSQPARLVNGSPVLFKVRAPKGTRSLTGKWLGHDLDFSFDKKTGVWFALAGVSFETKPGSYPIELHSDHAQGAPLAYKKPVTVLRQRYPKVLLKVPGKYTAPSPEDQRSIEADKKVKADIFQTISGEREWRGNFAQPVKADISDVFGVQRVFNGSVQSTHQGLDFRVPAGTPVAAVNDGTVLLARPMFFEGNFVVLDHGQGLLTLYLHLSRIDVKEGEHVTKGQIIAISGGTGRATGPHLHLAVRWQGVYVNPAVLLSMKLP